MIMIAILSVPMILGFIVYKAASKQKSPSSEYSPNAELFGG